DDPDRFIRSLEERLGIEASGTGLRNINPSLTPTTLHWYRVLSTGASSVAGLAGKRLGSRLYSRWILLVLHDRLQWAVRLLDRLLPERRVNTYDEVPNHVVEACRGRAARLGERDLYAPYAAEYLNE